MTMREQTLLLLARHLSEDQVTALWEEFSRSSTPDAAGESRCLFCGEKENLVDNQGAEVAWENWEQAASHKEKHRLGCLFPVIRELHCSCCHCGCGLLHHTLIRLYGDQWHNPHAQEQAIEQQVQQVFQSSHYSRRAIALLEEEGPAQSFVERTREAMEQELYGLSTHFSAGHAREQIAQLEMPQLQEELYPLVLAYHREVVAKADAEIEALRQRLPVKKS